MTKASSPAASIDAAQSGRPPGRARLGALVPYLAIALLLWAGAEAVLLWAPSTGTAWGLVTSWAYSQALLLNGLAEKIPGLPLLGLWAASYLLLALSAWSVIELPRNRMVRRSWRRAVVTWFVLLVSYSLLVVALIGTGQLAD